MVSTALFEIFIALLAMLNKYIKGFDNFNLKKYISTHTSLLIGILLKTKLQFIQYGRDTCFISK